MSNVYLAVCHTNNHLGAAFYDDQLQVVHILNDIDDTDYTSLTILIKEVKPTYVIASRAQDSTFLKKLRILCNYNVPNETINDETTIDDDNNDKSQFSFYDKLENSRCVLETPVSEQLSYRTNLLNKEDTNIPVFNGKLIHNNEYENQKNQDNDDDDDAEDEFDDKFYAALTLMPFISFDEIEAKKRIETLFTNDSRNSNLMASFRFDFTFNNMIRAFGALLRFMDQQRINVEFDDLNVKTPIKSIVSFVIDDIVEIDNATLKALQIFESEYNPSMIKKKNVLGKLFKDGISLFSLCNMCRSTPGKQLMKRWFEHPTIDRDILTERHNAISFFYQDCNLDIFKFIRSKLKNVSNIKPILKRFKSGSSNVNDFINVYETLLACLEIMRFQYEKEVKLTITKGIKKVIDELLRLVGVMKEVIDFDESLNETRFVVNIGLDEELDEMKRKYSELPAKLTKIAEEEAGIYGIESCSVAYVPIIGYLLVVGENVKLGHKATFNLKLVYNAENDNYYKTPKMDYLDNTIGDIKIQIIDEEKTIMMRLQKMLLQRSDIIIQAVDLASKLDCITSFALVARELNWHRPQLVDDPIIDVGNARHPLSELTCQMNFVANPIKSGMQHSKIKLISGPNASGKSVYLKSVGIIAYLTHIGSFVPADYAIIGPINRIVTRMYTIDSVMDGMSSFANDLKQISGAIRKADKNSLVILDEFGKGTMTEVGLSLLASSLNYWIEKDKDNCPHLFSSSHFHSLNALLLPCDFLSYQTLDVIQNSDELEFQYKLIDGMSDNSFASYTALKHGISRDVVKRANEVYNHLKEGKCLIEVPQKYVEEDEDDVYLIEGMEQLLDLFTEWDLSTDLNGFLNLAKIVLTNPVENEQNKDDDDEDGSILNGPVQKKSKIVEDLVEQTPEVIKISALSEYPTTTKDFSSTILEKTTDKSNLSVTFHSVIKEIHIESTLTNSSQN